MSSRVARKPIAVPTAVEVVQNGQTVKIKGKFGEQQIDLPVGLSLKHDSAELKVECVDQIENIDALAGTTRALINNLLKGVAEGYQRKLLLVGVGYRAKSQGQDLELTVGFSHPVKLVMPEGVKVSTPQVTEIVLEGSDKRLVNQMAANIRAIRPPERYKGKGIRYSDEKVTLKEAKKK